MFFSNKRAKKRMAEPAGKKGKRPPGQMPLSVDDFLFDGTNGRLQREDKPNFRF